MTPSQALAAIATAAILVTTGPAAEAFAGERRHARPPVAAVEGGHRLSVSRKAFQRKEKLQRRQRVRRPSTDPISMTALRPAEGSIRPLFGGTRSPGERIIAEARRHLGTNPTGMSRNWCARFMNQVLAAVGLPTSGSDLARSFVNYGRRIGKPRVGAIAVLKRGRRGGHVGVVVGVDDKGNPILISGNHSRTVAEATYPRHNVIAYVTAD